MSNKKWVCFRCRLAVRRAQGDHAAVLCSGCGEPCTYLGYKIPVPPKNKVREWEHLAAQLKRQENEAITENARTEVARQHELEREIARLEGMRGNEGRVRAVKLLRKKLEGLRV
jgi:hypothetical protein